MQAYEQMVESMTGRHLTPDEKERAAIAMQPNRKDRRRMERDRRLRLKAQAKHRMGAR